MKCTFSLIFGLFFSILSSQTINNIKIDSLYFSGKIPKMKDSNMTKILSGIQNICDPNQKIDINNKIESNIEFRTISTLNLFNKEAKTSIFTSADIVIVSYFCQNIDYVDGIEFYEFIFEDENSAKILLDKLYFLYNKQKFNDYIGVKNWFFKKINSKVYFINAKLEQSDIKNKLQKNIESID